MKFIKGLSKNITIIMIAQRLSTLENCESVLTIENRELLKFNLSGYFLVENLKI